MGQEIPAGIGFRVDVQELSRTEWLKELERQQILASYVTLWRSAQGEFSLLVCDGHDHWVVVDGTEVTHVEVTPEALEDYAALQKHFVRHDQVVIDLFLAVNRSRRARYTEAIRGTLESGEFVAVAKPLPLSEEAAVTEIEQEVIAVVRAFTERWKSSTP